MSELSYQDDLTKIIIDYVAPNAAGVDRAGEFPGANIEALQSAGLLAVTVPTEFGGGGLGLSAATDIVRQLSTACGSTAMVLTMHFSATAVLAATGQADA